MADLIDQAFEYEQANLTEALYQHANRAATENNPDIECVECGVEIPEARRKARPGCLRCVTCQEDLEQRNDRNRRLRVVV